MIWGRCCSIHGERAKLLDRAAAAAHVGCCVCCVLCFVVVFCVGEQLLATITVESQHWPRPFAMNFVHFQTKMYQLKIQNIKRLQNRNCS
jgi:hypothetical protein